MLPGAIPIGSWSPPKRVNNSGRGPLPDIGSLPPVAIVCALWFASASAAAQPALTIPDAALEPVDFNELEGWPADDRAAAFAAFLTSCRAAFKTPKPDTDPRPMAAALRAVCGRARAAGPLNSARAAAFFEGNFRPMRIFKLGETSGFLTGYYEPIVEGSRLPTPIFHTPLYRRPDDLVVLGAPHATDGFPNKAAVGRKIDDRVLPGYFDRGEIEDGALDGRHLEICWIKDPIDALIIQIQGSARIRLEDGLILRVNYDAHNGWPYTPVGRPLIERNIIPKDEMSLDRLRTWMQLNPDAAREVRRTNRSFVFFRISGLGSEEEPIGGEGVRLTAGRSLAVDKTLHVYGTPFFIEAALPLGRNRATVAFHRLMIAQDTGSAIVGPARADLYFGAGDEAGHAAGVIRHNARMVMLIPREIDPAAVRAPRPRSRPAFEAQAAREKATLGPRAAKPAPHRRGGHTHPWAP
jgi:membrane-bound lytic murein transglycosylase A